MFKILKFSKTLISISKTFAKLPKRTFTDLTGLSEFHTAESELQQKVTAELHQEDQLQEREELNQKILNTHGWEMECNFTSTRIILSKTLEDCLIKVFYDARAVMPNDLNLNEDHEQTDNSQITEERQNETDQNNEELADPNADFIEFFVLLDKGKKDQILFDLFVVEGEIIVNGMITSPDIKDKLTQSLEINKNIYQGPKFLSMDETFQEKIYNYLTSVGITNEFGKFIEESSALHENRLHLNFLKKFNEFLA